MIGTWYTWEVERRAECRWSWSRRLPSRGTVAFRPATWESGPMHTPNRWLVSLLSSVLRVPPLAFSSRTRVAKPSHDLPWHGGATLKPGQGGWNVIGPSPVPFHDADPPPLALDEAGIHGIIDAFEAAARRALLAGFQIIEIHAAHGYLLHEFLSPISNRRTDSYGGTLENRMRLLLEVSQRVRQLLPQEVPLFVRISATDWVEEGWDIDQSVILCQRLKDLGIDLIDVSSGGMTPKARIPVGKGYQVPFARRIRAEAGIRTGAVRLITEPRHANEIITGGDADLVFLARELLREPYWR